jgi:hypothetical protein
MTSGRSALALLTAELTAARLAAALPQPRLAPRITYSAPLRSLLETSRRVPPPGLAQHLGWQPPRRRPHRRDAACYGRGPAGTRPLTPRRLLWRR